MNLTPHVETLRNELLIAAEAGGDEARVLAERLIGPLQSATRLILLEVLSDAANEITRELAPGSVDVRIRGRDPEVVVTLPAFSPAFEDRDDGKFESVATDGAIPQGDADGGTSRVTLRLPEQLKLRVEEVAGRDGLSVNAWLSRAVAAALDSGDRDRRPRRRGPSGGERYTGWVH
jgi:hypothetical protein